MALDLDCKTTEYYVGNGNQKDFTFSWELLDDTDLRVGIYNTTTNEYDETTAWTKPDSTSIVRFDAAPDSGARIVIYRLTDIDPMKAIFHPGHPVKASDLNDNFEQLQFAVEESRCFIEGVNDSMATKFWNKETDTVYSTDPWVVDDEHVATTAAIDAEIDDKLTDIINNIDIGGEVIGSIQDELEEINQEIDDIKGDIIDINTEVDGIQTDLSGKVDKVDGITTNEQKTDQWVGDDVHFAYTGALSERYDVVFLDADESSPQPEDGEIIQPGKFMITSDNNMYVWNGGQWFQPIAGGGGGGGDTQIVTSSPLTQGYSASTKTYNLGFNIDSLNSAPAAVRSTQRIN